MKFLSKQLISVEDYAYDTLEECSEHAKMMIRDGFEIRVSCHDIYLYYREYVKYC